ncbi:nicotinate (nicotinamide) nucleotide adenylyltransferase [Proteinivorax hydrogeniformans]|uniref:Probable nicotinate-nucleotide adenylyltransferase n=1 Tax=Proteinivorax hydrogeniformans TaxID=1826727 RepID=A0AAU8HWP5_9FIRM
MSSMILFGGSFDPIHMGHLIIAEYVKDYMEVDKVVFLPNGVPPHKKEITSSNHRLKMVELAISDNPSFDVSTYELQQQGTNYTYKTIKYFSSKVDNLYFFAGADSLVDFPKWKNPKEILSYCKMVIAKREGYEGENTLKKFGTDNFIILKTPIIELSSTQIRKRLAQNKSCKYLIHPKVEDYILDKGIYNGYN